MSVVVVVGGGVGVSNSVVVVVGGAVGGVADARVGSLNASCW